MQELNKEDLELIEKAREVIKKNYDGKRYNHTVGLALRCKSGRIYLGVNVYSVHGTCAEQVSLGSAITDGERDFDTIVAVDGENGRILSPCGNCRPVFPDYMPDGFVNVGDKDKLGKVRARALIPYSYHAQY